MNTDLSTLDPMLMTDREHAEHFGYSRIDAIIEEGVQQRLRRPAPKLELTATDRVIAMQLGISQTEMLKARLREKTTEVEDRIAGRESLRRAFGKGN